MWQTTRRPELGISGRVRWREDCGRERTLAVRFAEASDGRLVPVEARVERVEGLSSRDFTDVPLARLVAAVNGPTLRPEVVRRLRDDSALENRWNAMAVREDSPAAEATIRVLERAVTRSDLRLASPKGRLDKGDDFYRRVAVRYAWAAALEKAPARAIAKANNVPVTTVHRWIKEARHRGFLPPGRPGTVG